MRLADVCVAIIDCEHKTAPEGDGFAMSVGTKAIKDGRLELRGAKPVSEETYAAWTRRMRPEPGDLILAREAPVGDVVRVPNETLICLGQRTVLIRPDEDKVHPRFLHYWLLGPDAQGVMRAQTGGATVGHLNVGDIRKLDIAPMPTSAAQQDRTARLLGGIDDLIENNRRRVAVLEEMARAIYREWFVKFRYPGHEDVPLVDSTLGPIPEGWELSTCGAELTFIGGGTPSKSEPSYWDGGDISWYTPTDLTKTGWRYTAPSELAITAQGLAKSSARLFPAGSVMMTSRATLGVLAIATTEATTNQGFIVILPDERWKPGFIYEWLDSKGAELSALGTGATFKEITKGSFKSFPFVVPTQSVLDDYRVATEPLENQVHVLEQQTRSLSALRDLLLPKLVTGQIDVSALDLDALLAEGVGS